MSSKELNIDDILMNADGFDDSDADIATPLNPSTTTPSHAHTTASSVIFKPSNPQQTPHSQHPNDSTISLSHSAALDTLQTLFSSDADDLSAYNSTTTAHPDPIPSTFFSFYQKHAKFFNLHTHALQSPIERRLQQYQSTAASTKPTTILTSTDPTSPTSSPPQPFTSALFSLTKLSAISHQLDEKKQFTGVPTAVCTNHRFICIGTSLGFVWLFDQFQTRYGCLGTATEHRADTFTRGHVVSIDITPDGEFLLVAHRTGLIVVWDILEKKIHKVVDDFQMTAAQQAQMGPSGLATNVLQILALPKLKFDQTVHATGQTGAAGAVGAAAGGAAPTTAQNDKKAKELQEKAEKVAKEQRHLIPFLFATTNGGVAVVNLQRKFLVWTTDVKWVMNNAEKPILHIALLSQPQTPLPSSTLTDFHQLARTSSMLGQPDSSNLANQLGAANGGLASAASFLGDKSALPPPPPLVVEKFNLISVCFEERVMVVALEPLPKVLGVIPRDFVAPPAAVAAGLKFHPIIRPFGPISSSWRPSRALTGGVSGAILGSSETDMGDIDHNDGQNEDEEDQLDALFKSVTLSPTGDEKNPKQDESTKNNKKVAFGGSIISGTDYTQVYDGIDGVCKSYYTGTRSYQHYAHFPLLSLARGTLLQLFTAFPSNHFDHPNDDSTPGAGPNAQAAPTPTHPLPISMEKILILAFPTEIVATTWINEGTLLVFTSLNPGIPQDLSPPNPTQKLTVFAIDATSLRIFEHFAVPSSITQGLNVWRSSEHQKSLTYDHTYHTTICSTMGSNGFATVLGQHCAVNTVKMLNFIDRVTQIAENDWILALAMAYDSWLKLKQSGSALRATRGAGAANTVGKMTTPGGQKGLTTQSSLNLAKRDLDLKAAEIAIGVGSLRELSALSAIGMVGEASNLAKVDSTTLNAASFFLSQSEPSPIPSSLGSNLITNMSSLGSSLAGAMGAAKPRLHPRDLLYFQTSPVFRHLLHGYTPPTPLLTHSSNNLTNHHNTNKVPISDNDLVLFNHHSPSCSILDANLWVLLNAPTENSQNTPAVHNLCEKIVDLIVLQVDTQLRTYSTLLTAVQTGASASGNSSGNDPHGLGRSSTDGSLGSSLGLSNNNSSSANSSDDPSASASRQAIMQSYQDTTSLSSSTSSASLSNSASTTAAPSLQDEWQFALALITVTVHTAIDICLKLNRSDVLLKLILPRLTKVTTSLLSHTSSHSLALAASASTSLSHSLSSSASAHNAFADFTENLSQPGQAGPPGTPSVQTSSKPIPMATPSLTQHNLDQLATTPQLGSSQTGSQKDLFGSTTQNHTISPLLFTFRETPAAHPTTIFLHRIFTVILTGHRNDSAQIDQRLAKHTTSYGTFHPTPASLATSTSNLRTASNNTSTPSDSTQSPPQPIHYQTISPLVMDRLAINRQRLLIVDDFFLENTAQTLLSETKFTLWLLRDNAALQRALQTLYLAPPEVKLMQSISQNSLVTFSHSIKRFLIQFKVLLVNIHPIYLAVLANNSNPHGEGEKKKLLPSAHFPVLPHVDSPAHMLPTGHGSEQHQNVDTVTYPIYAFHVPLLDFLYAPPNFASSLHLFSSTPDLTTSGPQLASAVAQPANMALPLNQPAQTNTQATPPPNPSQTLAIASILQLVGQHLHNGLDVSYIASLVKHLALVDEFLHLTQGLFSTPLISHHLLHHFGYLHNLPDEAQMAAMQQTSQPAANNSTSSLLTPTLPRPSSSSSSSSLDSNATLGRSYTALHYLFFFLTQTSPHHSPYRPTLFRPSSSLLSNPLTRAQNIAVDTDDTSPLGLYGDDKKDNHPHLLLTTLFYHFNTLLSGRSFYNNANIQFVLPRLALSHVRAAQQRQPKLFELFTKTWETQQNLLATHQQTLHNALTHINTQMREQTNANAPRNANTNTTSTPLNNRNNGKTGPVFDFFDAPGGADGPDFFSPFDATASNSVNLAPLGSRSAQSGSKLGQNGSNMSFGGEGDLYNANTGANARGNAQRDRGLNSPMLVLSTSPSSHTASLTPSNAAMAATNAGNYPQHNSSSSNLLSAPLPRSGPSFTAQQGLFETMVQYAEITSTTLYRAQIVSFLFSPSTLHSTPLHIINPRFFSLLRSASGQRVGTIADFVGKVQKLMPPTDDKGSKGEAKGKTSNTSTSHTLIPYLVHNFPHLHLFLNELNLPSGNASSSSSSLTLTTNSSTTLSPQNTSKLDATTTVTPARAQIDPNHPFSLFFALLCDLLAFPNWILFTSTAALFPPQIYPSPHLTSEPYESAYNLTNQTPHYAPHLHFNHYFNPSSTTSPSYLPAASSTSTALASTTPAAFGSAHNSQRQLGVGSGPNAQGTPETTKSGQKSDNAGLGTSIPQSFISSLVPSLTEANKPKLPHIQSAEDKRKAEEAKRKQEEAAKLAEKKAKEESGLFGWFGKVSDFVSSATGTEKDAKDGSLSRLDEIDQGNDKASRSLPDQQVPSGSPSVATAASTNDGQMTPYRKKTSFAPPTVTLSPEQDHYQSLYSKLLPFPVPSFHQIIYGLTHTIFSAPHLAPNYNPYALAFQHIFSTLPELGHGDSASAPQAANTTKQRTPPSYIPPFIITPSKSTSTSIPTFTTFYPTHAELKNPAFRDFFLHDNIANTNPLQNHTILLLSLTYYGLLSNLITLVQLPPALLLSLVSFACLAPPSHVLAIYLLNLPSSTPAPSQPQHGHGHTQQGSNLNFASPFQFLSHTSPRFSITPPFADFPSSDLYLFHPSIELQEMASGGQIGSKMDKTGTKRPTSQKSPLSPEELVTKAALTQQLHTPRELLLLSLIPFVAGTTTFAASQYRPSFTQFAPTSQNGQNGTTYYSPTDATTAIIQPVPVIYDVLDQADFGDNGDNRDGQKLSQTLRATASLGYFIDLDEDNSGKVATLLFLAESSSFSRALLSIYIQQRNFSRVLTSFLAITQPLIASSTCTSRGSTDGADLDAATGANTQAGDKDSLFSSDLSVVGSFEDGGLIEDGQDYDSSSDEEDDDDGSGEQTKLHPSPSSIPTTTSLSSQIDPFGRPRKAHNPSKSLLRMLSKQLFSYISSELYTSLSTAIQSVLNDNIQLSAASLNNGPGTNTNKPANQTQFLVNPRHFDEFFAKLNHVLSHAEELLQIYPLGIVTLYVFFSTALSSLPQLNFQTIFLSSLTQPTSASASSQQGKGAKGTQSLSNHQPAANARNLAQNNADPISQDSATLYLFLKHLLYCYDLHQALNRGSGGNSALSDVPSTPQSSSQLDDHFSMLSDSPDRNQGDLGSNSTSLSNKNSSSPQSTQANSALEAFTTKLQSSISLLSTDTSFTTTITPAAVASLMSQQTFSTPVQANRRYLELLCKFEPKRVYSYLLSKSNYAIDHALELCQKYQIFDALAYILERTGDLKGSLDLLFKVITREAEQVQPVVNGAMAFFLPLTMQTVAPFYLANVSHYVQTGPVLGLGENGQPSLPTPAPDAPKLSTAQYLALQRQQQDEQAFRSLNFGPNNDAAHPSPHLKLNQYQDRVKHLLFANNKFFSALVMAFPPKLRRLIFYPVQIAMNLCQRASEQGSAGGFVVNSGDLSSMHESTATIATSTSAPNSTASATKNKNAQKTKEVINTQLNEWEALWMDLLILLIQTERTLAQTRLTQYTTNTLPKLTALPTAQDVTYMQSLAGANDSSRLSKQQSNLSLTSSPSTLASIASTPTTAAGGPSPQQSGSTANNAQKAPTSPLPLQSTDVVLLLLHASIVANIQRVLTAMLEYLPADKVLATTMKPYQNAPFSSFQPFFTLLIESIVYELSLRGTTKRLLQTDHHNNTTHLFRRLAQPLNYSAPLQRLVKMTSNRLCASTNPPLHAILQQQQRKRIQQQALFNMIPTSTASQFDPTNVLLCLDSATMSCYACLQPLNNDKNATNGVAGAALGGLSAASSSSSAVVLFGCGHVYHDGCCGFDSSHPDHAGFCDPPKATTHTGAGVVLPSLPGGGSSSAAAAAAAAALATAQHPFHCPTCLQRGLAQQQQNKGPNKDANASGAGTGASKQQQQQQHSTMQSALAGVFAEAANHLTADTRYNLFQTIAQPVNLMDDDDVLAIASTVSASSTPSPTPNAASTTPVIPTPAPTPPPVVAPAPVAPAATSKSKKSKEKVKEQPKEKAKEKEKEKAKEQPKAQPKEQPKAQPKAQPKEVVPSRSRAETTTVNTNPFASTNPFDDDDDDLP